VPRPFLIQFREKDEENKGEIKDKYDYFLSDSIPREMRPDRMTREEGIWQACQLTQQWIDCKVIIRVDHLSALKRWKFSEGGTDPLCHVTRNWRHFMNIMKTIVAYAAEFQTLHRRPLFFSTNQLPKTPLSKFEGRLWWRTKDFLSRGHLSLITTIDIKAPLAIRN